MQVSFIGTGLMGSPMAERLLKAGHEVYVYNRTLEKTVPLKQKGAKVALTAHEARHLGEAVFLMLSDAVAVNEMLFPTDEEEKFTGQTVIQMSTISPDESRAVAEKIITAGGDYLEAPVLGSIPQATEGKLVVMVGAQEKLYEKWHTLLEAFGPAPIHIGEVGKAAAMKLALNQLIASLTSAFSLSLGMIMKEGIEVEQFMNVLRNSALYAKTFDVKLNYMLKNDFSSVNFPAKHLLKDVRLTLDEAKSLGLETVMLEAVQEILKKTVAMGSSDMDYSVLFNAVTNRKV
ncbi:MAG: NAD(P)-dependent oxidoreductase [Ignavibacteria bacterium]|jgi:3-hydroxyisobutyrate dehydrogenase|nr:NAD(P)-dependent oxidoreductase [Ignavibacteria bacterium]MCU7503633.1 NAD(P)-dependent oxidoreductase [Ignavibacteria bacterium]MCU7517884.1 NAD(P)-dependent oxidoreductase [Ignavibacteria bacterium]